MTHLLHIDTSGEKCFLALGTNGKLTAFLVNTEERNHAANINTMVNNLLAGEGLALKDIAGLVVCAGPGSYTGLRIGLSTAKGYCYALNVPLFLDNKLTLLALQSIKKNGPSYDVYYGLIKAREKEFFLSGLKSDRSIVKDPTHITNLELDEILNSDAKIHVETPMYGDELGLQIGEKINVASLAEIDVESWLEHGFAQYNCNNSVNLSTSEPFYLKQVYTHK